VISSQRLSLERLDDQRLSPRSGQRWWATFSGKVSGIHEYPSAPPNRINKTTDHLNPMVLAKMNKVPQGQVNGAGIQPITDQQRPHHHR